MHLKRKCRIDLTVNVVIKIINFKNEKMKRKSKFLIAMASAIITFSLLFATIGKPKYLDRHHYKTECNQICKPNNGKN